MSSLSRGKLLVLAAALGCALGASGCDREARDPRGHPLPENGPVLAAAIDPSKSDPRAEEYMNNAASVSNGQTYYSWMNCVGCHANGGGGMGPALMDSEWRYGSSMESIVNSITYGRPNGMPAFAGRMTPQQIWQVAAFVRTMSARDRQDVRAGRAEGLSTGEPASLRDPLEPITVTPKQDEASVR
jgi:cytochrome c oxidase cbb3-type subunit 3